jgi:hypothetical protein
MLKHAAVALAILALTALDATAGFKSLWKSPEVTQVNMAGKKVVALIVSQDMNLRMSAEEALARELTALGANGVAAYRLVPAEELRGDGKAKVWFEQAAVDAVLVMRLLSDKEELSYSPSFWTTSYYGSFWGYYGYAWDSLYVPGYWDVDRVFHVETLIYRISNGHLLWASVSEKTNPKDLQTLVQKLVGDITKQMRKDGLLK